MARLSYKMKHFIKEIHYKKKRENLYRRYALILLTASLYIILGFFNQIPFFVFQILFLIEGLAYLQEGSRSSLKYSNFAMGGLCIFWVLVSSMQTSLATGYTVSVSNQVVVCNLIYIALLGFLIYQIHQRKELFYRPFCKGVCMAVSIVSIVAIALLLIMVYSLYLVEAMDLELTALLISFLTFSAKILEVLKIYPIAEWLVQGSILCFILLQSNKTYTRFYSSGKRSSKHHVKEEAELALE